MKLTYVILLIGALAALAYGQSSRQERRLKLKKLIALAKSGDVDAKNTLASLRSRLKSRGDRVVAQTTTEAPRDPIPFDTPNFPNEIQRPTSLPAQAAQPIRQSQPLRSSNTFQSRRPRVRVFSQEPDSTSFLNEPHRALNRGLEVDERSEANAIIRVTNETNTPPVQTIRRYSYFDEEGNYIFGYEAADGSFKEEKRGRNCIVHGKYGYVDPDGIRREYNYVSGNVCDPDAPVEHDLQGNEINPLPKNNQFLVQTEERKLEKAQLDKLQFNQIRRPVQQQQPQFQQQPRNQHARNRVSSRRRQQNRFDGSRRGNAIVIQEDNFFNQVPQEPEIKPIEIPTTQTPIRISTFRPAQPIQFEQPSFPVFRPTPRPISSINNQFDFDQEFQNIFNNNFGSNRPRPAPRPQTFAPLPPPTPRPTPKPTSPPKTEIITTPRAVIPPTTKSPHQLVFDSASGGFKTVPLKHSQIATSFITQKSNPAPPPPPKPVSSFPKPTFNTPFQNSFNQIKQTTGRPLPLSGFNPLPPVPLGSLSIRGNTQTADFDRFFSHFKIK